MRLRMISLLALVALTGPASAKLAANALIENGVK